MYRYCVYCKKRSIINKHNGMTHEFIIILIMYNISIHEKNYLNTE